MTENERRKKDLLTDDCHIESERLRWIHGESDELISIFTSMSRKVKRGMGRE
jgi:hypothetical protein